MIFSNNIFEDNPELGMVQDFKALSKEQMLFVALVSDYESPLRGMMVDSSYNLIADYEVSMRTQAAICIGEYGKRGLTDLGKKYAKGRIKIVERAISYYKRWKKVDSLIMQGALKKRVSDQINMMMETEVEGSINDIAKGIKLSTELDKIDKAMEHLLRGAPKVEEYLEEEEIPKIEDLPEIKFNGNV